MSAPASSYLDDVLNTQASSRPAATDTWARLTRYIFNPFHDRQLTLEQMRTLGGMTEFKADFIIPITEYQMLVKDYDEIGKVPKDYDGEYQWTPHGVDGDKPFDRAPAEVVEAIFTVFNRDHDTGTGEDKGICEVECMRGNNDLTLWREINRYCLPSAFKTAREQIAHLEKAGKDSAGLPALFGQAAERLLKATRQAQAWARGHYEMLRLQLDDRDRTGKYRLSPLDAHVCEWLEYPHPRRRSSLIGDDVAMRPAQAAAQVWCEACGTNTNLSLEGRAPRFCPSCKEPFGQAEAKPPADEPRLPAASEADQQAFAESVGDVNLDRKQQEMRDRQQKRR